jgi:hypothetical protein
MPSSFWFVFRVFFICGLTLKLTLTPRFDP